MEKAASLPFVAFRFLLRKNLGNLFPPASLPAFALGVWGKAPNSENQNASCFGSASLPPPFGRKTGAFSAESATVFRNVKLL
jgi:hypothetical protein